jgi:hypothetical protein
MYSEVIEISELTTSQQTTKEAKQKKTKDPTLTNKKT